MQKVKIIANIHLSDHNRVSSSRLHYTLCSINGRPSTPPRDPTAPNQNPETNRRRLLPDACTHSPESDSITITFDHRGGARWRSTTRFQHGTFSAKIQCPKGNTSGLNFNIYLSSLEGDKSEDEIDFEFLGKDKTIVQINYYTAGTGNRETIHDLGFYCSDAFHEYVIKWTPDVIEWLIDGKMVRREKKKEGEGFPEKPMFLYASVWDASYIDEGRWTGPYLGCDAPYVCHYKDVRVPVGTAVHDDS